MICPNCERNAHDNEAYCLGCGLPLKKICPKCKALNEISIARCKECGKELPHFSIEDQKRIEKYKYLRELSLTSRIITLITGITAFGMFFFAIYLLWWFSIVGLVLGITSIACGIISRRHAMGKMGLILGSVGFVFCLISLIVLLVMGV